MVFLISLILVILFWSVERLLGIPWDFHPDAETYVTSSYSIALNILDNPTQLFNNGHYAVTALMNSNVILITVCNCVLFSITNSMIYKYLKSESGVKRGVFYYLILFGYLFNPYRMHLATTILKDTFVIFLLVHSLVNRKFFISALFMLVYRLASIIYFSLFVPRRYFKYFFMISIVVFVFVSDTLISHMNDMNEVHMQFRDFDLIPSFQNLGLTGSIMRAILWPIISLTGLFYLISPAVQYFPLAAGSFFILIYCIFYVDCKLNDFLMPVFIMAMFALLVTGYTSYFRYIFPVVVTLPIYLIYIKNAGLKE
jgi:hypothetical protein